MMPMSKATSVPGFNLSQRSANWQSLISRGLMTISLVPFLTACLTLKPMMGWAEVVLVPIAMIQAALANILNIVGLSAAAECGGQTGHRRGMSNPGTVIDVVGPQHRPSKFLSNIVVFIAGTG